MKLNAKTLFEKAYGNFCVPAINISNPEQVTALFSAAQKHQAPFIVQTSPAAREYISAKMILSHIGTASSNYPDVVYAVHVVYAGRGGEDRRGYVDGKVLKHGAVPLMLMLFYVVVDVDYLHRGREDG